MRVLVLGYGKIGRTIARDLVEIGYDVTAMDKYPPTYSVDGVVCEKIDSLSSLPSKVGPYDIVVGALPGSLGYEALDLMAGTGKKYIDVSFMPQNQLDFHDKAERSGTIALVDMGLAPGIHNLFIGWAASELSSRHWANIWVGGNPIKPFGPSKYLCSWSAEGVVQEYTEPARILREGEIDYREPFYELIELDWELFPGRLEAFLTDGLRTLLFTKPFPNMKEFTMRWPGHAQLMLALDDMGFFLPENFKQTSKVLSEHWQEAAERQNNQDFVALVVHCQGNDRYGNQRCYTAELYDEYDPKTGDTGMARTTGFTVTAGVKMLASGIWKSPGVVTPEALGAMPHALDMLQTHLAMRGVKLDYRVT